MPARALPDGCRGIGKSSRSDGATQISISNEPIHVTPQLLEKRGGKGAQTAEGEVRNAAPLAEFHADLVLQK